jgi:hypothetical protein
VKLGMKDFDLSSLEPAEPRLLTQRAGQISFGLGYSGVFYHSRYGNSIENWAIFEDWAVPERFPIRQPKSRKVAEDDPDLLEALRILGLVIGDRWSNPKRGSGANQTSGRRWSRHQSAVSELGQSCTIRAYSGLPMESGR